MLFGRIGRRIWECAEKSASAEEESGSWAETLSVTKAADLPAVDLSVWGRPFTAGTNPHAMHIDAARMACPDAGFAVLF